MRRLLIRNGTLVTPREVAPGHVLVEDGTIAAVGPALSAPPDAHIINAEGLLVFPGLIDAHVHLREPGGEHKEDFATGTRAALAGGFTTVLAMPNTSPAVTDRQTLAEALRLAASKAVCDFGLFVGATASNADEAADLENAVALKLYMGSSTGSLLLTGLAGQVAHFERCGGAKNPTGLRRGSRKEKARTGPFHVIAVHAEDEEAVAHFAARGQRRPPLCAALAVARALALAERYQRKLHVCHVSTAQELALIRDAKARGLQVTCEVAPHHLFLTAADEGRLGPLGHMNPPLRPQEDVESLWAGLDLMDCLATDHAPHTLEEKRGPTPPAGVPGLETALPLLLTAVHDKHLSLCEVSRLLAAGPAHVFGLTRKGRIAPGCEGDLTLVDVDAEWVIGEQPFFTKCGWSPFEGQKVRGRVEQVFLRGQEVYSHGEVLAQPGCGQAVTS